MFIAYTTIHFSNNFVLPYQCLVTKFACAAGPKKAGCSCILRAQPNSKQNRRAEEQKRRTARKTIKLAKKTPFCSGTWQIFPQDCVIISRLKDIPRKIMSQVDLDKDVSTIIWKFSQIFLLLNFTKISNKFHLLSKRFFKSSPKWELSRVRALFLVKKREISYEREL